MTPNERLWQQYYAAIKAGKKVEADAILKRLHNSGKTNAKPRGGGCGRCRKRFD